MTEVSKIMSIPEPQHTADHGTPRPGYRCGQFVLGPVGTSGPEDWRSYVITEDLVLVARLDLNVTCVAADGRALTLIGFMLDPRVPEATDLAILRKLLAQDISMAELGARAGSYGGRWALVATRGEERYLVTDTLGMRQVFYTNRSSIGTVYAMSEPGSGAQMLGLQPDPEAAAYAATVGCADPEYRWPVDATAFREIRKLLPNHYLDLRDGVAIRFWPHGPLVPRSVNQCVEEVAPLIKGMLAAAANRYELAVAVTAGIDSRVVLAACRDIKERLRFVTVKQWHARQDHPDLQVATVLLKHLGLPHDVVQATAPTSSDFRSVYKASVFGAHDHYAPDAEAILRYYNRERVTVTGSGGEIGRCPFREYLPLFDRKRVTPAYLSKIAIGRVHPFAERYFAQWMATLGADRTVNALDLFEWEQECGSWIAMTALEFDIAWKDIFTPFNCRDVLVAMLATPPRCRKALEYGLFHKIAAALWPETLDLPVNPHRSLSSVKRYLRGANELLRHAARYLRYH